MLCNMEILDYIFSYMLGVLDYMMGVLGHMMGSFELHSGEC